MDEEREANREDGKTLKGGSTSQAKRGQWTRLLLRVNRKPEEEMVHGTRDKLHCKGAICLPC